MDCLVGEFLLRIQSGPCRPGMEMTIRSGTPSMSNVCRGFVRRVLNRRYVLEEDRLTVTDANDQFRKYW